MEAFVPLQPMNDLTHNINILVSHGMSGDFGSHWVKLTGPTLFLFLLKKDRLLAISLLWSQQHQHQEKQTLQVCLVRSPLIWMMQKNTTFKTNPKWLWMKKEKKKNITSDGIQPFPPLTFSTPINISKIEIQTLACSRIARMSHDFFYPSSRQELTRHGFFSLCLRFTENRDQVSEMC